MTQSRVDLPAATPIRVGAWRVDPISSQISKDQEIVRVEARTMRLLMCLAERAGDVVSIDELLDHVWAGVIVTPDSVYQAITSLRRLLGDDPKSPNYIATVPRLGYRMVATVTRTMDVPATPTGPSPESAAEAAVPTASGAPRSRKWGVTLAVGTAIIFALVTKYLVHDRMAAAPQKSVAILPFVDLTTQEMNEEYFADGMTEELIGDLSKIPGLQVPAPTSSFFFKGKQLPVADIARQLNVAYILDGSVRKSGDIYRVAARLVRADSGYVAWSETYDRPLGDLVNVQKDIAIQVTKAVRVSIEGNAKAAVPASAH
jgi:transcriptional activator of cad operon